MKALFKEGDKFHGKFVAEARLEICGSPARVGELAEMVREPRDNWVYPCRLLDDGAIVIFWEDTLRSSYILETKPFRPGYYRSKQESSPDHDTHKIWYFGTEKAATQWRNWPDGWERVTVTPV